MSAHALNELPWPLDTGAPALGESRAGTGAHHRMSSAVLIQPQAFGSAFAGVDEGLESPIGRRRA
jgi:hypothetical protein